MGAIFAQGFGLGFGLIVAIGSQNAFVLRQGLLRRHLFVTALICSTSDAILIFFGIYGFGAIVLRYPSLILLTTWGGSIFLFFYGLRAFWSLFNSRNLYSDAIDNEADLRSTILATLAFTWLNPHVYLDTLVLVGSVGTQFADGNRLIFGAGAAAASIVWFFGLAYGAAQLAPWLNKPITWRILNALIGIIMWWIAFNLVAGSY